MTWKSKIFGCSALAVALLASPARAQGPGSCGVHLDIIANLTSTHSAVADSNFGVGAMVGIPAGAPGNPYQAYATPGTIVTLVLTVPAGTLGSSSFGLGAPVTILWSIGAPDTPFFPLPGFLPTCPPLPQPWILSVLPFFGAIVDGLGIVGIPPFTPPADPGYPLKMEIPLFYPGGIPSDVSFQAIVGTSIGLAVSNGVRLLPGPNPNEASVLGGLVPACGNAVLDDSQALAIASPPGFTFYGVAAPTFDIDTNGFLDFLPGATTGGGCDLTGSSGDFGCAVATAHARPRIDVNHFDAHFGLPVSAPFVTDLTVEFGPPGFIWPARTIVRWKNVAPFGSTTPLNFSSHTCELWGDGRIAIVRERMKSTTSFVDQAQLGIGPGLAAQGFGGPPTVCPGALGMDFTTTWGTGGLFMPFPNSLFQNNLLFSVNLTNLAVFFNPAPGGAYTQYTY